MKLLRRLLFTFISTVLIFVLIGYVLYVNKDRFIAQNQTNQQFERRKNELLGLISKNYLEGDAKSKDLDTAQLKGIVGSLNDPYSTYFSNTEYGDFQNSLDEKYEGVGIGFNLKKEGYVVTKVLTNSPAEKKGVLLGDMLKKVDDQDISNLDLTNIGNKIRGKSGTDVKITILRGDTTLDFVITRAAIANDLVTLEIKNDVAIIGISSFGNNVSAKFREMAQKIITNPSVKYLVLDLRSNTGGLLNESVEIASYLQKPDQIVVIEQSKNDKTQLRTNKKDISLEPYPLVVITDQFTASASEILAGSLRDNRNVKLIGQKTYGKGVVQSIFTLKNGDTLKLTIAKWLTPNGSEINKQGLSPDIRIIDTEDPLQKAIDTVKTKN
jgi:carboxyl-terminal processing protease